MSRKMIDNSHFVNIKTNCKSALIEEVNNKSLTFNQNSSLKGSSKSGSRCSLDFFSSIWTAVYLLSVFAILPDSAEFIAKRRNSIDLHAFSTLNHTVHA